MSVETLSREHEPGVHLDDRQEGTSITIEDLNSKNGTYVRDVRIAARAPLESGDRIRIGPFTLTVHVAGRLVATESESQSG